MNLKKSLLTGAIIAAFWGAAGPPEDARAATVKIGGSGFGLGVMKILAGAFEKSHPGIRIEVIPSLGSSGGIKALGQGALDIAISSRPPTAAETGKGMLAEEIARTPFIFAANKGVNKEGVTTRELENIYSGKTTAWPDGTRIRPILRPATDTVTKIVRGISPAMNQAVTLAMSREGMIRAITDQESADMVEKTPGALEAGTLTQVSSEKRQVNVLSFNGVKPTVRGIADGSYPLSVPMYLVMKSAVPPAARGFADFIRSGEGSSILKKYGNLVIKERKSGKQ